MDQLAVLEKLEKVAAIMRRRGMHRLTRLGRNVAERVLRSDLTIQFDDLYMCASIGLRGFLYRVRSGRMEPFMSRLFKETVRPGSVVLDIGACVGYYTLLAAQLGAKVYAFEADKNVARFLLTNIQKNGFSDRVVAISKAVSDKTGSTSLFIHDDDNTQTSCFDDSSDERQAVQVETLALDDFFDETVNVDVIKMDIEGAELHALQGMKKTLARANDLKLFIECNPAALRFAGHSARELVEALSGLGLHVMAIDEQNYSLTPALEKIDTLQKAVNLYCVKPSKV